MKKFAQTALLIAGLTGLSACATDDVWTPYGTRTAGHEEVAAVSYEAPKVDTSALASCQERARRLESMNRTCYRK